ncbi:putative succinyl-CoA ligase [ADP-forming] subunit alpha, mitochondrial [Tolypocladium ophioglossoides CBS 100239]|uniref:Putative succinyl-CoA ligase [ADP-forming] subunit alpha, mitochondrial n=1 Tax=Tolypocladium ophioglossoides (strain CBS 100239) TaxID=1163406 RepID=A0A0L0NLK3_TOLOC|nr:putative succinyl-CoA ligase [ADP-forming] subunit alpha, mitochondrial [Tolypocladium ophioglossoides CBS 100239]
MTGPQEPGASAPTPTPTTRDADDAALLDAALLDAGAETRGDAPENGYRYGSLPRAAAAAKRPAGARALAPDLLRGLLMTLMALDHTAMALHTWQHGTNRATESDGVPVRRFNFATAYVVRTLTHLCGGGFAFLLGMGVVYLGRARARLGWAPRRLARYFAARAAVLTAVTAAFGWVLTGGQVWFLNAVLFALAVDYLLAGLLWLALDASERRLAARLAGVLKGADGAAAGEDEDEAEAEAERRPLRGHRRTEPSGAAARAASLSWHLHNGVLLALSVVTIFWNIWLSESHGHCTASSAPPPPWVPQHPLARIWFWPITQGRVLSGFPPLAWLSFAILGLLYGRAATQATANAKDTIEYGTRVVGGVSPGKGGQTHLGLPVFGSVREAARQVDAHVSAVFVPAAFAARAIIEAVEAEVPLVVSVAEHMPVHDLMRVHEVLRTQSRSRLVGPNCPGVMAPEQCRVGIMPFRQYRRGRVGIVSKSGTLSYEAVGATSAAGLGHSLVVVVGGDAMPGTTLVDALTVLFDDGETEGVVVIGEIGGEQELRAADMIAAYRRRTPKPKPVVAMVAGQTAPRGRIMGHAGAVLSPRDATAAEKAHALEQAGAVVVPHPGVMGTVMRELLG